MPKKSLYTPRRSLVPHSVGAAFGGDESLDVTDECHVQGTHSGLVFSCKCQEMNVSKIFKHSYILLVFKTIHFDTQLHLAVSQFTIVYTDFGRSSGVWGTAAVQKAF